MGQRPLGCERGRAEGLECLFKTGTWAKLRRYNVPAIIELSSPNGDRRYATVVALGEDTATLDFGGRRYVLPFSEVDRYWEGPFIVLWRAASVTASSIAPGARGKDVEWVRQRLSELDGAPVGRPAAGCLRRGSAVPRDRVPARPIAGRRWDRRRGDPAPPERRRARSGHPAPVRDGLLTGRRNVLYPRRPQESRAEAAARAKSADARHDPSPARRGPSADSSAALALVGRGRRDRRQCRRRDLAPAPGRDEAHRIAGQAGLILAARHRGAVRARRHGLASARPWGRAPAADAPAPSAPAPPRAPATPGRPVVAPPIPATARGPAPESGRATPNAAETKSGARPAPPQAAVKPDQPSVRIRRTPHRPSRLLPLRRCRPQTSPSRAPRPPATPAAPERAAPSPRRPWP